MDFIGRKEELQAFKNFYDDPTFGLAMVYGRRRVGKTQLVLQSLLESPLPHLYFQCRQTSQTDNATALSSLARESIFPELPISESFEDVLRYFFVEAIKKPFILVLDEYPFLKQCIKGLDSIVQSLIQSYGEQSQLKLVLLGSYIASMKESVGLENGPLRGRAKFVLDLKAMDYKTAALFTPNYQSEDKFFIYSLFGGIPYYLSAIKETLTPEENLFALFLNEKSLLRNEADYVLSEVGGESTAREVLEAIASGYHSFTDIMDHTSLKSSSALSWSLNELQDMELVVKEIPLNEPSARKAHYKISDPFLSFYYGIIYPRLSQLQTMDVHVFYDTFVKPRLISTLLPHAFEKLSREYLVKENKLQRFAPPFYEVGYGVYNDKKNHLNGEFDALAKRHDGFVYFECKYEERPLALKEVHHLEEQLGLLRLPYVNLGFFSRQKPEKDTMKYLKEKGYYAFDLNEIYSK
jgi:AAA+ ATPase superfamily predicted ATPase